VPARAREWTGVPYSSFPRMKGCPVRVRASALRKVLATPQAEARSVFGAVSPANSNSTFGSDKPDGFLSSSAAHPQKVANDSPLGGRSVHRVTSRLR
jgi:hypothetical protein